MKRTRRAVKTEEELFKPLKIPRSYQHYAQRKFATSYPPSPVQYEKQLVIDSDKPKPVEDFIQFLCVRNEPYLPKHLECFAEPLVNPIVLEENNSDYDDDDNGISKINHCNNIEPSPESTLDNTAKDLISNGTKKQHGSIKNVNQSILSSSSMKDIFQVVDTERNGFSSMLLTLLPSSDWKVQSYDVKDVKFNVTVTHIERLRNSLCENFLKYQCMFQQLKKESKDPKTASIQLGLNEIDLPLLYDIVNSFGGVEMVHSTQNWKYVADQVGISKSTSRRVMKLEELYLKFILPYALLSDLDKENVKNEVLEDQRKLLNVPKYEIRKSMSLVNFHKFASNLKTSYVEAAASCEEVETKFWEIVTKGERRFVGIHGEIEIDIDIQPIQSIKGKSWSFRNLFLLEGSALKFLGEIRGVTQPKLVVEGVFATSEWRIEKRHMHLLTYLHSGAEKIWYVIPETMTPLFDSFCAGQNSKCLFTPDELISKGISLERLVQREGEYIVIKPNCYHLTVNTDYSCSEVVLFAPMTWFNSEYFKRFKFNLEERVVCTLLINYATSYTKKRPMLDYVDHNLVGKLIELKCFISSIVLKLDKISLANFVSVKSHEVENRRCVKCDKSCYLMSAVHTQKDQANVYCIDDIIDTVNSNQIKSDSSVTINMIINEYEVDKLLEKLKKNK